MAITISNVSAQHPKLSLGNVEARLVQITWDNSYPAGGESFTPALLGMSQIFAAVAEPILDKTNDLLFPVGWDNTANTLQVFQEEATAAGGGLPELGDTSAALNGLISRVLVIGAF